MKTDTDDLKDYLKDYQEKFLCEIANDCDDMNRVKALIKDRLIDDISDTTGDKELSDDGIFESVNYFNNIGMSFHKVDWDKIAEYLEDVRFEITEENNRERDHDIISEGKTFSS